MLLDNFQKACQSAPSVAFTGNNSVGNLGITSSPTNGGYYSTNTYGWYCDVGFDDTAVAHDDYKLSDSNILDTPSLTFMSSVCLNTYPAIRTVVTTYKNEGSSDVVVKELGFVGKTYNSVSAPERNVLIARKVLDTPITVPAGATMAFTYAIEMDFSESVNAE